MPQPPRRTVYGRTRGKTLKPSQRSYLAEDLDALRLSGVTWAENPKRAPVQLPRDGEVWLEIGFGAGEHLVHQAALRPDVLFIGAEPFIGGVARLLGKIRTAGVSNVLVHPGDARDMLEVLPEGRIGRAFLLYPDPWPKKRHHRRRFVTPEPLALLARVLRRQAVLRIATDIPDYVRQALLEVPRAGFTWQGERPHDWRAPWSDWLSTRYEQKALREGRRPHYLTFQRD